MSTAALNTPLITCPVAIPSHLPHQVPSALHWQPTTLGSASTPPQLHLLDQRALPFQITYLPYSTASAVAEAITTMVVRGAPAIGITGAFGVALAAYTHQHAPLHAFTQAVQADAQQVRAARPTAVNLMWAVDRQLRCLQASLAQGLTPPAIAEALATEALTIWEEDIAANLRMGELGAALLPANATLHTHCNAGAIATGGYGTALGVVRTAFAQGRCAKVFADETRPRLQGGQLTAWELVSEGIPTTVVSDGMCGHIMQQGLVNAVLVGADRIAANGDTANKIGTYTLALAAKAHGVPFYVVAPTSTLDLTLPSGASIPIEERCGSELTHVGEQRILAQGIETFNPGFDVTPASHISAIITEKGVAYPPFEDTLRQW
jgi:methylthioribose-1-phosphate isomerase